MNSIIKPIAMGLLLMLPLMHRAQEATVAPAPTAEQAAPVAPLEFSTNRICYTPHGFAVIDSIENAIELATINADGQIERTAHYTVDAFRGRHDTYRILRPVSLTMVDGRIVFLATARDSSYLGVLELQQDSATHIEESFRLTAAVGFGCHNDVFNFNPLKDELIVVGFNPTGYDINMIDLSGGIDKIATAAIVPFHYHVPKQAESIKATDPYGVGLTLVAVLVVFLSLMCIAIVLKGFGTLVQRVEQRNEEDPQAKRLINAVFGAEEEVYVAIAAAINLYDADMHDEEDNVLTIQKVERAWTPWNAKFYNMNQYFNRNSR